MPLRELFQKLCAHLALWVKVFCFGYFVFLQGRANVEYGYFVIRAGLIVKTEHPDRHDLSLLLVYHLVGSRKQGYSFQDIGHVLHNVYVDIVLDELNLSCEVIHVLDRKLMVENFSEHLLLAGLVVVKGDQLLLLGVLLHPASFRCWNVKFWQVLCGTQNRRVVQ